MRTMPLMSDKRISRLLLWAAFVLAVVVVVEIIAGIGAVCALADPSALPRYCLYFNALKDWQTFLAAGLGFGGLIWVARRGYAGIIRSTEHAAELALRRDDRHAVVVRGHVVERTVGCVV